MISINELKKFDIKTKKDVKAFAEYVINELKCAFHPDDSFADLVKLDTGEQVFDDDAITYLDELNNKCFDVCGDKYYDISCNVLKNALK